MILLLWGLILRFLDFYSTSIFTFYSYFLNLFFTIFSILFFYLLLFFFKFVFYFSYLNSYQTLTLINKYPRVQQISPRAHFRLLNTFRHFINTFFANFARFYKSVQNRRTDKASYRDARTHLKTLCVSISTENDLSNKTNPRLVRLSVRKLLTERG